MAETRDIRYINRNFDDFKSQLMEYAKAYFPDAYNDFGPSSPGLMFIEMAAYVEMFYHSTKITNFRKHFYNTRRTQVTYMH